MQILSEEAEVFFTEQRAAHKKHLRDTHGISSVIEYLECVDKLGEFDDPDTLQEEVIKPRGITLNALYQITPMIGQNIMYASLNPGMHSDLDRSVFVNGEYGRKHEAAEDGLAEVAWKIASHIDGYLTDTRGAELLIEMMRGALETLPTTQSFDDYVDVDSRAELADSFFGDVYLTRAYKFPSEQKSDVDNIDFEFARGVFAEEIEFVNPDLMVCTCKPAWMAVFDGLVENTEEEIVAHNDSTVTDNYSNRSGHESAVGGVFKVPEYDLWVVTTFHESREHFFDISRFVENLNYADARIEW